MKQLPSLFLGLREDAFFSEALAKTDPNVIKLFISDTGDSYLRQISIEGVSYIGKILEDAALVSDLELLEKNILSILKKLTPDYPCESASFTVLPFSPSL